MIKMMPRKVCLLNPKLQLLFVCCLKVSLPGQHFASRPSWAPSPALTSVQAFVGFFKLHFSAKKAA